MNKVLPFPFKKTVEHIPNDARQEFLFDCCDGLPPARQKRLIVRARSPEIAFIDGATAEVLIAALGLGEV